MMNAPILIPPGQSYVVGGVLHVLVGHTANGTGIYRPVCKVETAPPLPKEEPVKTGKCIGGTWNGRACSAKHGDRLQMQPLIDMGGDVVGSGLGEDVRATLPMENYLWGQMNFRDAKGGTETIGFWFHDSLTPAQAVAMVFAAYRG